MLLPTPVFYVFPNVMFRAQLRMCCFYFIGIFMTPPKTVFYLSAIRLIFTRQTLQVFFHLIITKSCCCFKKIVSPYLLWLCSFPIYVTFLFLFLYLFHTDTLQTSLCSHSLFLVTLWLSKANGCYFSGDEMSDN